MIFRDALTLMNLGLKEKKKTHKSKSAKKNEPNSCELFSVCVGFLLCRHMRQKEMLPIQAKRLKVRWRTGIAPVR